MIAVMVVAILTVSLMPAYRIYFAQSQVKGATEALYEDMNKARDTAIAKTTTVTVTLNTSSWCYGVSSDAITCDCTSAASTSNCNLGITMGTNFPNTTMANTFSGSIVFSSTRGTIPSVGTVTFSATADGIYSAQITVNTMGLPSICSPSGTIGGYPAC